MSRSHSRRTKPRAAAARRSRREAAQRPRWSKIGRLFFETWLCPVVMVLMVVPVTVWDAWLRLTIRRSV